MKRLKEIKEHLEQTSFSKEEEYPMSLWTFHGSGLFSDGQEGFTLGDEVLEIDNPEDLEFLAKAPDYIKELIDLLEKK